jgi:hypothetical protein
MTLAMRVYVVRSAVVILAIISFFYLLKRISIRVLQMYTLMFFHSNSPPSSSSFTPFSAIFSPLPNDSKSKQTFASHLGSETLQPLQDPDHQPGHRSCRCPKAGSHRWSQERRPRVWRLSLCRGRAYPHAADFSHGCPPKIEALGKMRTTIMHILTWIVIVEY